MMADAAIITRDLFLGGKVAVFQPEQGYRAGLDAVLLAASLDDGGRDRAFAEAGCGAGAALLCAAARLTQPCFTGFERDEDMAAMMERSAAENGFGDRVLGEVVDIAMRPRELENRFDQAFANPPFFEKDRIRPPSAQREASYVAETPLKAWVLFLCHVTKPGGRVTMIHRAGVLGELLELLGPRTGEIEVLPVRPAPGEPAKRILVRARKGLRRGDVRLHDGLVLHEAPGAAQTARAASLMSGAKLEWR